jgi:hypothetical protein
VPSLAIGAAIAGGFSTSGVATAHSARGGGGARGPTALAEDGRTHRVEGKPEGAQEAYARTRRVREGPEQVRDWAGSPPQQIPAVAESRTRAATRWPREASLGETERRPRHALDPRHGPSARVEWARRRAVPRLVPACDADAQRVSAARNHVARCRSGADGTGRLPVRRLLLSAALPGLPGRRRRLGRCGEPVAVGSGDLDSDDDFDSGTRWRRPRRGRLLGGGGGGDAGGGGDSSGSARW